MLKVSNLTKSFDRVLAVDHIFFHISIGEIFGFLGPNGAGKTTTINMICGLLNPDAGEIELDGQVLTPDRTGLRHKLGVVPQEIALYEELNAYENLRFWGRLYDLSGNALKGRIHELLQLSGLAERARDRVKTYSSGMKRRLNMIAGLLHRPALLLLDEPTVGIDPQGRHNILDSVREIAAQGTTILYTTHYLDEAEALCDRLAIIDHGRILAMGTEGEIKSIVGENAIIRITGDISKEDIEPLTSRFAHLKIESQKERELLLSFSTAERAGDIIEAMYASGLDIENLQIKEPSLDSAFIKLTGRELRD
ncbi:ABC transporter ATP-binding protein [candidate division KSB1 bacterium]|nr:ABC transporter ATP-binding protein [candidate division KSB1 bacterium]RQW06111.1 MAG: ABC transporter ATP-binding protein [candidate division KSB1 bacterium]